MLPTWPENGDIEFRNVSMRYDDSREPVIRTLNLHIPAGQKVLRSYSLANLPTIQNF